jgi:hypothetical protein
MSYFYTTPKSQEPAAEVKVSKNIDFVRSEEAIAFTGTLSTLAILRSET